MRRGAIETIMEGSHSSYQNFLDAFCAFERCILEVIARIKLPGHIKTCLLDAEERRLIAAARKESSFPCVGPLGHTLYVNYTESKE